MAKKYRNESIRLQNWDYGWNAAYFITINTHNREHFFGKIIDGKMQLSEIGEMAEKYWHEIPAHFPFVKLGAFVVMPDHIHGIIIIDKKNDDDDGGGGGGGGGVRTQDFASPQTPQTPQPLQTPKSPKNKFGPQSKNLASIVRGYKIGVTKNAKKTNPLWKWQSKYHDRIIRDNEAYQRIESYIINNPKNWNKK